MQGRIEDAVASDYLSGLHPSIAHDHIRAQVNEEEEREKEEDEEEEGDGELVILQYSVCHCSSVFYVLGEYCS